MLPLLQFYLLHQSAHCFSAREIIKGLDEKEALVLKLRFGLVDDKTHTLQEIGDKLHLTRERIRQIEKKAMRKLARSHKLRQLRGYLN